jgi:hypothetical protein
LKDQDCSLLKDRSWSGLSLGFLAVLRPNLKALYTSHLSQALQQDWIVYHRTAVLSISFPSFPFLRRQPFPCTSVLHSNSPLIGDTYALTDLGSYKQNTILGFWKNSFPRYICSSLNTSAPKLQITVCAGRPIRLMISQITSSTVSTPRNT